MPAEIEPSGNEGKSQKKDLRTIPTHIEGVYYRVEDDAAAHIILKNTKRGLRSIAARGTGFLRRDQRIKVQEKVLANDKSYFKKLAEDNPGWRGVISSRDKEKFGVSVTPQAQTIYDRDLLKESLGSAYKGLVNEELALQIDLSGVPEKKNAEISESLIADIKNILIRRGVPDEQIDQIMKTSLNLNVDKDRLNRMIDEGRVVLKEGAKTEKESWRVQAEPFRPSMLPKEPVDKKKRSVN